jgi:hypothetical protein
MVAFLYFPNCELASAFGTLRFVSTMLWSVDILSLVPKNHTEFNPIFIGIHRGHFRVIFEILSGNPKSFFEHQSG